MKNRRFYYRRSRYPLIFTLIFLITSLFYLFSDKKDNSRVNEYVRAIKVFDGDTILLKYNNEDIKVRLIGIDAPEMEQRPWGKRAKRHLERILKKSNNIVKIELDIERYDKYERLLAYLWTPDGNLINEIMIRNGYAVLLTIPPNVKYVERFIKAEETAKKQKKGIWSPDGLKESPEEFKRRIKEMRLWNN